MEHGKLPVNHEFDSLGIGTLQGHLKKLGYYHDEPCGVFGPGTTSALQTFLKDKGFYRYQINGNFDGATKAAMNEFLHNYQNPDSTYRRQYSNLWTRSTTKGMRQYLHDIGARVYFTGERWGEKCRKGAWEWKTTETIQQFLNDNFEAKLDITRSMNGNTVIELKKYLNRYLYDSP